MLLKLTKYKQREEISTDTSCYNLKQLISTHFPKFIVRTIFLGDVILPQILDSINIGHPEEWSGGYYKLGVQVLHKLTTYRMFHYSIHHITHLINKYSIINILNEKSIIKIMFIIKANIIQYHHFQIIMKDSSQYCMTINKIALFQCWSSP